MPAMIWIFANWCQILRGNFIDRILSPAKTTKSKTPATSNPRNLLADHSTESVAKSGKIASKMHFFLPKVLMMRPE